MVIIPAPPGDHNIPIDAPLLAGANSFIKGYNKVKKRISKSEYG